jgi:transcriptional regulator with XRE-family HTH domain
MRDKIEYLKGNIAKELRKLRAESGQSQTEVVIGINEKNKDKVINIGTLVRYEKGSVTQNLDKLVIILDYYKLDIYYFFKLIYENMYRNDSEN